MIERFDFEDVEQCIRLAKKAIDLGVFDAIAEAVYLGLGSHEGATEKFLEVIEPYYTKAQENQ